MIRAGRSVCLLSLGSQVYVPLRIKHIIDLAGRNNSLLTFVCLDSLEIVNSTILGYVARTADHFKHVVAASGKREDVYFELSSDIERDPEYATFLRTIVVQFETTRQFRNACLTQTYQSLQPRLNRIGVYNQRHPVLVPLAAYVVRELALLAYLGTAAGIDREFS